jgi:hypothetical protein
MLLYQEIPETGGDGTIAQIENKVFNESKIFKLNFVFLNLKFVKKRFV